MAHSRRQARLFYCYKLTTAVLQLIFVVVLLSNANASSGENEEFDGMNTVTVC